MEAAPLRAPVAATRRRVERMSSRASRSLVCVQVHRSEAYRTVLNRNQSQTHAIGIEYQVATQSR